MREFIFESSEEEIWKKHTLCSAMSPSTLVSSSSLLGDPTTGLLGALTSYCLRLFSATPSCDSQLGRDQGGHLALISSRCPSSA